MSFIKKRTCELLVFIWSASIYGVWGIRLSRAMTDADITTDVSEFQFFAFLISAVVIVIFSLIFIFKAKKSYNGSNFLQREVVILDEDERALKIHYQSKDKAKNMVELLTVLCIFYLVLNLKFDIQLEMVIAYACLATTVHAFTYYKTAKKLYYE